MPDYLSRQPYLDLLKSIIANQSNNPLGYSFAIDGEWGCGKTWILKKLECQLAKNSDIRYLIFHYNAWKNDFYEEPLVAILYWTFESSVWGWIEEDKVFLKKYDEIMDMLIRK